MKKAIENSLKETTPFRTNPNLTLKDSQLPCGIMNVGNSCYSSSVFQILFNYPHFAETICRFRLSKDAESLPEKEKKGVLLVQSLQKMFGFLTKGKRMAIDPKEILELLVNPDTGERFVDGRQKDVTEFLDILFKGLGVGLKHHEGEGVGHILGCIGRI